jgi:hypothetical protein
VTENLVQKDGELFCAFFARDAASWAEGFDVHVAVIGLTIASRFGLD